MQYRDVALLNDSIDKVGDSILRSRMLDQQQANTTAQQGLQQEQIDDTRQRYQDASAATNAKTVAAQKASTQRVWQDTTKMFGGWVKDGIVDPEVAQTKLQAAYAQMPDAAKAAIADDPAAQAIQNGDPIWQKPQKTPPALTPGKVGNRDVMIGPGGSVHYTDEFSPADKLEVEDVNANLRDINTQARELATSPDPAKARALNVQRSVLQTRKATILQKYSTDAAAAPAAPAPATVAPDAAAPALKPLDAATAAQILQEAGGDRNKARQLATQRGYAY